jgi:signal peptidase I
MAEQPVATLVPQARRGWRLARRIVFWVLVGLATAVLISSLAILVRTFRGFVDGSPTMENTVKPGQRLFVAVGTGVRRGDVVVLHVPATATGPGNTFVKRVIGLPGDHVACCDARGRVTVNGKPLDETYVHPGDPPSRVTFSVTVGQGKVFVLGDHRNISVDSRTWGPVSERGIVGRVVLVMRGSSFVALRTPRTFVSDGLAPPDSRPDLYLRLALAVPASVAALLILAIVGITSSVIRGRRSRRTFSSQPVSYASSLAAVPADESAQASPADAPAQAAPPADTQAEGAG